MLAFVASFFAAANVVGGYAVTGRMLKMFRRKAPPAQAPAYGPPPTAAVTSRRAVAASRPQPQVAVPSEPNHRS